MATQRARSAREHVARVVKKRGHVRIREVIDDLLTRDHSDDEARAAVRATLEQGSVDLGEDLELIPPTRR